jgi:hypothetical protein
VAEQLGDDDENGAAATSRVAKRVAQDVGGDVDGSRSVTVSARDYAAT